MPFRHLPNEVLLIIARHLEPSIQDLNSFWQTSRHLNLLLGPLVLQYISQHANPLLLWASRHGRPAFAKTVLAHGGDIAHTDPAGWTLLHIAASRGHDAVVRFLLDEGISADALGAHGKSALERAAHFGHAGVVRILIKRGLHANAMDWDGQTPLHYAAARGQDSVVSVLIEGGAEIDIQGPVQGNTPLQWAAMRGHNSTALLLLDTGADIAVRDLGGRTVLHYAARSGDEDVVRLVLDRGADVDINVCNDSGETAFHTAVFEMSSTWAEKWKGVLKLLVNRGVDASKRDNGGSTGLDIAMDGGCPWSSELAQYSQTDTHDTQGFDGVWY